MFVPMGLCLCVFLRFLGLFVCVWIFVCVCFDGFLGFLRFDGVCVWGGGGGGWVAALCVW